MRTCASRHGLAGSTRPHGASAGIHCSFMPRSSRQLRGRPTCAALSGDEAVAAVAAIIAQPLDASSSGTMLAAADPAYYLGAGDLYNVVSWVNELVAEQLNTLTPASFAVVLTAGLVTSLSPCTLSVLPLTIGYIGGYGSGRSDASDTRFSEGERTEDMASSNHDANCTGSEPGGSGGGEDNSTLQRQQPATASGTRAGTRSEQGSLAVRAAAFSAGLATTLAGLGVLSTLLGGAYGQIGDGLPIGVSLIAIVMGLNLLEVLPLRLPSLDVDVRGWHALQRLPPGLRVGLQAYLAGLVFALAASPCSTPVLATLLAWVGSTQDPATGGALLLAYSLGYVAPLLVAALFTGALTRLLAMRQWSAVVTPASGMLLVAGGTFALLSRLV